jgi:hypothetical protein
VLETRPNIPAERTGSPIKDDYKVAFKSFERLKIAQREPMEEHNIV